MFGTLTKNNNLHHFFSGKIKLELVCYLLRDHQNLGSLTFAKELRHIGQWQIFFPRARIQSFCKHHVTFFILVFIVNEMWDYKKY